MDFETGFTDELEKIALTLRMPKGKAGRRGFRFLKKLKRSRRATKSVPYIKIPHNLV